MKSSISPGRISTMSEVTWTDSYYWDTTILNLLMEHHLALSYVKQLLSISSSFLCLWLTNSLQSYFSHVFTFNILMNSYFSTAFPVVSRPLHLYYFFISILCLWSWITPISPLGGAGLFFIPTRCISALLSLFLSTYLWSLLLFLPTLLPLASV